MTSDASIANKYHMTNFDFLSFPYSLCKIRFDPYSKLKGQYYIRALYVCRGKYLKQ